MVEGGNGHVVSCKSPLRSDQCACSMCARFSFIGIDDFDLTLGLTTYYDATFRLFAPSRRAHCGALPLYRMPGAARRFSLYGFSALISRPRHRPLIDARRVIAGWTTVVGSPQCTVLRCGDPGTCSFLPIS